MKLLLIVLLAFAPIAAQAADKPQKPKKNQALVVPNFAEYGIVSIGMAPVSSSDHNEANEREFRNAVETGFGTLEGYKLQQTSWFIDGVRKAGATGALATLEKSALNGAPSDSAAIAALKGKVQVDAVLFSRLGTWTRQVVDVNTRGQSFTQVGADFAMISLKDGAIVWRGNFLEKGDGPYNDPNTAEVTERDATGNSTARQAQLEPPSYREVLEKLVNRTRGTLPKPPAKS
jgi:Ni/Co efflux regulator RcnB